MENKNSIGAKIVALRKAKGCTQADLGTYLNISYQAVSKWEREESCPDFDTLSRIAQFFNVPISYFEKGNEEVAPALACDAVSEETRAPEKQMVGVCKDCGNVVYSGDEGETKPVLLCKDCVARRKRIADAKALAEKKAAEKKKQEEMLAKAIKQEEIRRSRNKGLIWGGIIAGILFLIGFIASFSLPSFGEAIGNIAAWLVIGGVIFTFVSQLFWDGAVVDCALAGGKVIGTPGVIFSFDLDGFIFLIAMKILFAVVRFLVWLLTVLVCVVAAIVISPFTFIPALHRVNSGDLVI